jgi:hypothetical protein
MRQVEHGRRFRERDWGMASQLTLLLKVVRCRFSIGVDFQEGYEEGGREEVMAVEVKFL